MTPARGRAVTGPEGRGLSARDAAIVELVGRCRLMTAEQIRSVFFGEQKSKTPFDRAMSRLATRQREIERVVAGGPEEARLLFRIYQLDDLAEVIHRNMK